ncbi:non-ribosomal peptide synthetase [Labrys okinawensis]|uniref:Non-ribosomal peptide synthetase n=1 Tax=Labrys okinawensis TaxID=346911 RepID=A0A2S9Q569_9HYPH|nr:hybrid non-ribosomal peptide synthetase/type I polyketide synthase [Labrys okinawensis]PRH84434.1 non-ribosomal peptide synthetase [Labrys okinawensis]
MSSISDPPLNAIAVIGMAGRFPGARSVGEFWQNLRNGVESITRFEDSELEDTFGPDVRRAPNFVRARPILSDVEYFDAEFFGMYPREAELTDPQHRVFLECAWEALEDGGYDPASYPGSIGVIAGCSMNTYFLHHVVGNRDVSEDFTNAFQVGQYPMLLGASREFLATRVSYKFNLNGPSFSLNTACSTSLMAIAQACQQLLLFQSDMVIAGGVSITFPQKRGYLTQEGGMVSEDGRCRPFDADARGTVFGSGAGAVLLKRLEDALADGDHIYAVVRGSGVNNDGSAKVGYTAPSSEGQAAAIMMAHANAGVDPRSISYVECHGTATPLGDPIEIAGLTKAFRATGDDGRQYCAIGSVKSNVGHLDAAAGVVGFIKTALSLENRQLPATLHFKTPNPRLGIEDSPFFVNAALTDWQEGPEPRRAGVSAFGVGGTNVHVVLEEAPSLEPRAVGRDVEVLTLSARSESALAKARAELAGRLAANPALELADVAHTLQVGRKAFDYRWSVACSDRTAAVAALNDPAARAFKAVSDAGVVFMFPGQGSQYPDMGRGLYEAEAGFRADIDRCAAILRPHLDCDLKEVLYPAKREADDHKRLAATCYAQPAIFTVEYALARLWISRGIVPSAMIGHSVGEFVAACLAGVFTLEEVLPLVAARGRLMQDLPPGGMLAVRLSEAELAPLLGADLAIAAINGPALCVAAGPDDAVDALEAQLKARGVVSRRLHTSHAFHSPMMDPIITPFTEEVRKIGLKAPTIPYVSGVTGQWITGEAATSPDYWARHFREPVRFADGLSLLLGDTAAVLLEVGAGNTLTTLALQGAARGRAVVSCLPDAARERPDLETMAEALGRLWTAGAAVDWTLQSSRPTRRRVSLPTYPFERKRYWIEPPVRETAPAASPQAIPRSEAALSQNAPPAAILPMPLPEQTVMSDMTARTDTIKAAIISIFADLSGEDVASAEPGTTFLEMGFDSLFLTQAAQELLNKFGLKVTFRALLGDLGSIEALTEHVAAALPPEKFAPAPIEAAPVPAAAAPAVAPAPAVVSPVVQPAPLLPAAIPLAGTGAGAEGLMRDQLQVMAQLMQQQLEVLRGGAVLQAPAVQAVMAPPVAAAAAPLQAEVVPQPAAVPRADAAPVKELPSRFGVYKNSQKSQDQGLDARQRSHIEALTSLWNTRSPGSKQLTQDYRNVLADPRAASGFNPDWKEMVYPVIAARSKGSRIWDVDGNEYIDLVNGYGQTMFGHAPDFVVEAVDRQLQEGFAIGPQSARAGKVAALFCEMTGNERATFCNTGSEAVMAAMRVARTVTGRKRVVMFAGDYHGQFDEVLVRGQVRQGEHRSLPVAPGIPPQSVENVTVLEYGAEEALAWIREHAGELAAVVVEPVQSRRPDLRPVEFLKQVRAITEASGTALVFDEVVTGFRMHPAGMQHLFDIKADLACYGKVVGGGLPVGVLAGKASFMDALDGGAWRYGDDSYPEVGVTFFAGTFVRHPLVLAALEAVLEHLKARGPALQEEVSARMGRLVEQLSRCFTECGLSLPVPSYGSLFYINPSHDYRFGSLLYYHLRARGIYVHEGFPCFLTTEHTDEDVARIVQAFRESIEAMQADGMLPGGPPLSGGDDKTEAAAKAAAITGPIAPTASQTEVWLSAQLGDEASCAFNESISLSFDGPLDEVALRASLNDVIARHDALRIHFDATGTRMSFAPELHLDLPLVDVSGEASPQQALKARIEQDARTAFDLVGGPLVRGELVRLSPDRHVLVFTAHHIVCDGWSVNVLIGELSEFYRARVENSQPVLAEPLPFSSYAQTVQEVADDEAYWVGQFRTAPPPLELPSDRARPPIKTFNGGSVQFAIERPLYEAVRKAGAKRGSTLFATLLAAFEILMGRLAGQNEVVVGIPAAGQSLVEDDRALVGHCVNLLPLRANWQDGTSFAEFLAQTKQSVLEAYDHRSCTLGTILRKLTLPRDASRLPLAEVQFNLERLGGDLAFPGLTTEVVPNPKRFSTFDLFANVTESANGLRIDCDYNADLFDEATILRWLGHYRTLLQAIADDVTTPIERLPLLAPGDVPASLAGPSLPAPSDPSLLTIHGLIEAQTAVNPEAVAALFEDQQLTYGDLDRRAGQLAAHLHDLGLGRGARVAVLVDRSLDMLVSLLAVLKAGCAYVPLATNHPAARLNGILAEADVAAVVTQAAYEDIASAAPMTILVDRDRDAIAARQPLPTSGARVAGEDLAYVIFTSGSTGKPKGVEVTHASVANFLASMRQVPGFTAEDRLLAVTTISFDIAALELYLPLACGGSVVIAPQSETADGQALLRRLQDCGATVMQATPITWVILLESGFKPSPKLKMLCGGEALPRSLADQLVQNGGELWNMYGPTETTIWSSVAHIHPGPDPITVGHPIANTQFHVLDKFDRVQPLGVVGELHIGGDGVARGYFRRPDLTAEKFIADNVSGMPGARLYRTGDLARLMPGGRLQLLGRNDHQVKLRGFRIELGEIEAAIGKAGLDVNAVILREDNPGDPRLVAYYEAPASSAPSIEALRNALGRDLPDYMIPSQWVRLDTMPRGSSGKLDRRALPKPSESTATELSTSYVAPGNQAESILAGICAEVLGQARVSVADDLLMLGADSIHIFQIVARANQAGLSLSAKTLLQHRTIAKAAATLAGVSPAEEPSDLPQLVRVARSSRRVAANALQSPER